METIAVYVYKSEALLAMGEVVKGAGVSIY